MNSVNYIVIGKVIELLDSYNKIIRAETIYKYSQHRLGWVITIPILSLTDIQQRHLKNMVYKPDNGLQDLGIDVIVRAREIQLVYTLKSFKDLHGENDGKLGEVDRSNS